MVRRRSVNTATTITIHILARLTGITARTSSSTASSLAPVLGITATMGAATTADEVSTAGDIMVAGDTTAAEAGTDIVAAGHADSREMAFVEAAEADFAAAIAREDIAAVEADSTAVVPTVEAAFTAEGDRTAAVIANHR